MRKLTIKRHKSIVACAVKDLVYIEDYQSSEITIQGVPCRKIGEIKNGEEKTFEIGEEKQKIFIVFELLLKDTFHTSITIEAGQEDVSLSGKHYYSVSGNPFRFDGVQLTEEEMTNQKKKNRTENAKKVKLNKNINFSKKIRKNISKKLRKCILICVKIEIQ